MVLVAPVVPVALVEFVALLMYGVSERAFAEAAAKSLERLSSAASSLAWPLAAR